MLRDAVHPRATGKPGLPVLVLLAGVLSGCATSDARQVEPVDRVDGLEAVLYDGLDVTVRLAENSGVQLFYRGTPATRAALRIGDGFVLAGRRENVTERFELMLVEPELLTFKVMRYVNRQFRNEGVQQSQDVLRVEPYDLKREER